MPLQSSERAESGGLRDHLVEELHDLGECERLFLRRKREADAAEDLPLRERLALWQRARHDFLQAALNVREGARLLREDRRRQDDVGDVGERVVLPCENDQELRLAEVRDDLGAPGAGAEGGLGDDENVDSVGAFRHQILGGATTCRGDSRGADATEVRSSLRPFEPALP